MANKTKLQHLEAVYGGLFIGGLICAAVGWMGQLVWIFLFGCAVLLSGAVSMITYWLIGFRIRSETIASRFTQAPQPENIPTKQ